MKIVFEKLQTSSKNVYVDFGNGTWQSYPVNEARTNGIIIPASCKDYSKIKIKGSTEIFPNMDVITGIKRYEKVGVDEHTVILSYNENNNTFEGNIDALQNEDDYQCKNYFGVRLEDSDWGGPIAFSDISNYLLKPYENDYLVVNGNILTHTSDMDFFVLSHLDSEFEIDDTDSRLTINGERTGYEIDTTNNKISYIGSGYFSMGDIYATENPNTNPPTYSIDKNSPGLQNLAEMGDYEIVEYESGPSSYYIKTKEINGLHVYEPLTVLNGEHVYIYTGSGCYCETNLKIQIAQGY